MRHILGGVMLLCYCCISAQGTVVIEELNLDDAWNQFAVSGSGVTVAIIDRGIDYRHSDFLNENGETRIKYIYDMLDTTGASHPDNPHGVGTIFTAEEINTALQNGDPPLTTDRHGHGTATAGLIGANGSSSSDVQFGGVARSVDFIIIKVTHDFFPAFDDQPQQDAFFDPSYLLRALDFARSKIEELAQPSVTLLNLGSIGGPTDGTSEMSRAIDSFVEAGHPLVCGVGDDGGGNNHASGTILLEETTEILIDKQTVFLRFDLWYSEDDRYEVTLERPDGTVHGPFSAPVNENATADQNLGDIFIGHRGSNTEFFQATSHRRELLIDFTGANGIYKVKLKATLSNSGEAYHATLNPATHFTGSKFLSHVVPGGSINDYSSSARAISPGDYVANNSWIDIDGISRGFTGQGDVGQIWAGCSQGPTHDDRLGIDFVTPGEVCFAPYRPDTWYSNFSGNIVQGGEGNYGIQNAVSAAAPVATGIIALMLEINNELTPDEILQLLQNSCREDAFTGEVPNNQWGHGKLDALEVLSQTAATVSVANPILPGLDILVFPNPTLNIGHVQLMVLRGSLVSYTVHSSDGFLLYFDNNLHGSQVTIPLSSLSQGIYFVTACSQQGCSTRKVVKGE